MYLNLIRKLSSKGLFSPSILPILEKFTPMNLSEDVTASNLLSSSWSVLVDNCIQIENLHLICCISLMSNNITEEVIFSTWYVLFNKICSTGICTLAICNSFTLSFTNKIARKVSQVMPSWRVATTVWQGGWQWCRNWHCWKRWKDVD